METGRRGRPRGTSAHALEAIALELFARRGYDETTIDAIASEAGVSKRTFFRYFDSKADVLWATFDEEVANLRHLFDAMPDDLPVMTAVHRTVLRANRYRAEDVSELRRRMTVIASAPELAASAAVHYDAWERAVIEYVARRLHAPVDSLYPLAVGRATLAACRAAYEIWTVRADADLTVYLDAALGALAVGFTDAALAGDPRPIG